MKVQEAGSIKDKIQISQPNHATRKRKGDDPSQKLNQFCRYKLIKQHSKMLIKGMTIANSRFTCHVLFLLTSLYWNIEHPFFQTNLTHYNSIITKLDTLFNNMQTWLFIIFLLFDTWTSKTKNTSTTYKFSPLFKQVIIFPILHYIIHTHTFLKSKTKIWVCNL